MKVSDLADASFRLVFGAEDARPITALDRDNWLQSANYLLENWANVVDLNYTRTVKSLTLSGAALSYTIGQGGGADFNHPRPLRVISAHYTDAVTSGNSAPLAIIPEYGKLMEQRTRTFAAANPRGLHYRPDHPNGTILFVVAPTNGTDTLSLEYVATLTQFSTLATTVDLPDGLERAIIYNMAVQMCEEYKRASSPAVLAIAAESRANIARAPADPVVMAQRQQTVSIPTPRGGT